MPVIHLTFPAFTDVRSLLAALTDTFNLRVIEDRTLIEETCDTHGIHEELMSKVLKGLPIAFDHFTHDREKAVSALKKVLAASACRENGLFLGVIGHLIPFTHTLRVLASQDKEDRIKSACRLKHCSPDKAAAAVEKADRYADDWVRQIRGKGAFDPSLYNIVVSADAVLSGLEQIKNRAACAPFSTPNPVERENFKLSAEVQMALADLGSGLIVKSHLGHITVTIDKKRMNLSKLQSEILTRVKSLPGVKSADTKIGPNYYRGTMLKTFNLDPSAPPNQGSSSSGKSGLPGKENRF